MGTSASTDPSGRLPNLRRLSTEIAHTKVRRARLSESVNFLTTRSSDLTTWDTVEDLGVAAYDATDPNHRTARGFSHHIALIRGEVARQLWARQVFVGVTVLDELLFSAAKAGEQDPILAALLLLRDGRPKMSSLLVFPLRSFGILAAGLLRPVRGSDVLLSDPRRRVAVFPQTNDLSRTIRTLDEVAPTLGAKKSIDPDLIQHWRLSRGARWLERNPLLIAGVQSITSYWYENEFLMLGRIRSLTTALAMVSSMQPPNTDRAARLFSSSQINNWETRDIHHYLLLEPGRGKYMTGRAVPIHQQERLDELSELPIDFDPRRWRRSPRLATQIYGCCEELFSGYLVHSVGRREETSVGRTYRKIFEAVSYFRRSHTDGWTSVVSLATAFEMLLTDRYEPGVTERLRRRTQLLLRGVSGTRRYQQAVVDVYNARSATVHRGEPSTLDLDPARKAFVLAFIALMQRMPKLSAHESAPLAFLTGDL